VIREINSGNLAADVDMQRTGHRISTCSLPAWRVRETISGTCGVIMALASCTRVVLVKVINSSQLIA
jgi:hypothetical protein